MLELRVNSPNHEAFIDRAPASASPMMVFAIGIELANDVLPVAGRSVGEFLAS
jgi:hypothetical protein